MAVTGIGDINRNGYDDFLISEPFDSTKSNVQLFYGWNRLDTIPNKIFIKNEYDFGREVKNAGDLNKDGSTDFIITTSGSGRTYIFLGLDSTVTIDAFKWGFGGYIAIGAGGDINNDGYDDFLIGNTKL